MNKIKELRKYLKKKEIAQKLGVSLTTIERWEDDIATPSTDNQAKIDKLYEKVVG